MTDTILVVTEVALTQSDALHLLGLYGSDVTYHVLAPADTERNALSEFFNHIVYGEIREAFKELTDPETPAEETAEAAAELKSNLALFHCMGVAATGEVVADDPFPAITAALEAGGVREMVVVTEPKAVEDTFGTDIATKARERFQLPVLHIYTGTNSVG